MDIYSWNVNGIRAVHRKGFMEWLNQASPDILGLQETKAQDDQIPEDILNHPDYHFIHAPAQRKGYSSVAVLTKERPLKQTIGLGIEEFDVEGRTIILEYESFYLINGYFPNGKHDHSRVDYKLNYSDEVLKRAQKMRKKKHVVIIGDINTAHQEIDLANPKSNKKNTGFLPEEREWISKFLSKGHIDTFRHFYPDENGHYSWWSYRAGARDRNVGWRIDYIFINEELKDKLKSAKIHSDVLGSDHCPVSAQLKL